MFTIPWSVITFVPALKQMFDITPGDDAGIAVVIAAINCGVVYDINVAFAVEAMVVPAIDFVYIESNVAAVSIPDTIVVTNNVKFVIGACPPAAVTNALSRSLLLLRLLLYL